MAIKLNGVLLAGFPNIKTYQSRAPATNVGALVTSVSSLQSDADAQKFNCSFDVHEVVKAIGTRAATTSPATVAVATSAMATETTNDPNYTQNWGLAKIQADQVWASLPTTNVEVAVIDTGVKSDHEDLADNIDRGNSRNFTGDYNGDAATMFTWTIDLTAPTVVNVNSTKADGLYANGEQIDIAVQFNKVVRVLTTGGTPGMALETGTTDRVANYVSDDDTDTLTFRYFVQIGDASPDLDYRDTAALTLNGGMIQDTLGNNAVLTLPVPCLAGSLGANKALAWISTKEGRQTPWALFDLAQYFQSPPNRRC
ncbi:MAG: hypothetical protein WA705_21915 [Candidatus Ozemobacteraceae bacterium]